MKNCEYMYLKIQVDSLIIYTFKIHFYNFSTLAWMETVNEKNIFLQFHNCVVRLHLIVNKVILDFMVLIYHRHEVGS